MPITLTRAGHVVGAGSTTDVLVSLAQAIARQSASTVTALTDNSGGTVGTIVNGGASPVVTSTTGSNLADASDVVARFTEVLDSLRELATKANQIAAKVGVTQITWNGGGAAPNGTIEAWGSALTLGSTGAQATQVNATLVGLDRGLFTIARFVNRLCVATGIAELGLGTGADASNFQSTVSTITISAGSNASPGVTATAISNKLTIYRNSVATLASKINALRAGLGDAPITVI